MFRVDIKDSIDCWVVFLAQVMVDSSFLFIFLFDFVLFDFSGFVVDVGFDILVTASLLLKVSPECLTSPVLLGSVELIGVICPVHPTDLACL